MNNNPFEKLSKDEYEDVTTLMSEYKAYYDIEDMAKREIDSIIDIYILLYKDFPLCECLFEYCVTNRIKGINHIKKIAQYWKEKKINGQSDTLFEMLCVVFGRDMNKVPADLKYKEYNYIYKWEYLWNYSMQMIKKAINDSIKKNKRIDKIEYVDEVLYNWHINNIQTIEDYHFFNKISSNINSTFQISDFVPLDKHDNWAIIVDESEIYIKVNNKQDKNIRDVIESIIVAERIASDTENLNRKIAILSALGISEIKVKYYLMQESSLGRYTRLVLLIYLYSISNDYCFTLIQADKNNVIEVDKLFSNGVPEINQLGDA